MAFYVGQRVECIKAQGVEQLLSQGAIYVVRSINGPFVRLVGIYSPRRTGADGFLDSRFRPITERKTDISLFKAMLNPSKTEVEA